MAATVGETGNTNVMDSSPAAYSSNAVFFSAFLLECKLLNNGEEPREAQNVQDMLHECLSDEFCDNVAYHACAAAAQDAVEHTMLVERMVEIGLALYEEESLISSELGGVFGCNEATDSRDGRHTDGAESDGECINYEYQVNVDNPRNHSRAQSRMQLRCLRKKLENRFMGLARFVLMQVDDDIERPKAD